LILREKNKRDDLGQLGHTGFFLPLFFLQPGPVPTPGRPAGPGFKTMVKGVLIKL